jgi:hypothetical protein
MQLPLRSSASAARLEKRALLADVAKVVQAAVFVTKARGSRLTAAAIPRAGVAEVTDNLFLSLLPEAATLLLVRATYSSVQAVILNGDHLRERGFLQTKGSEGGGDSAETGGFQRIAPGPDPSQASSDIVKPLFVHGQSLHDAQAATTTWPHLRSLAVNAPAPRSHDATRLTIQLSRRS